ncbi:hypothetical protein TrCOL_g8038 [Triparma columacea]|uniref:Sulfotransferase n=1 Tax=Triparma columacea TaxID=722753 RepID=A0A9W7L393_9STRA|nr:hypothetical protein TrCOL_g8038 [Triparma columacea]
MMLLGGASEKEGYDRCHGVCKVKGGLIGRNNDFLDCVPRDPHSVLFLRIPKSASTRFLTLAERVKKRKGFLSGDFPDHKDAVMGPVAKVWNPRDSLVKKDDEEIAKYYRGVGAKMNLHAIGHIGRGGVLESIFGSLSGEKATTGGFDQGFMTDAKGRNLRMLWYGHMFLPDFEHLRQFEADTDSWKIPSVVTFVRDPILRLGSGYNYVRFGARSKQHREDVLTFLGNQTLTDCIFDEACGTKNRLRQMCSIQARYLCGGGEECFVHWHTVDKENYVEKLGKLVEVAKRNMESKILFTGVVEEMQESMGVLEALLPTYFEGIKAESDNLKKAGKEGDNFERDIRKGVALNVAKEYAKPTDDERKRIVAEGVCWADFEVYEHAKKLLKERLGSGGCASTGGGRTGGEL